MNNKDGGPAFPCLNVFTDRDGDISSNNDSGMTLRDWFAGQALAGGSINLMIERSVNRNFWNELAAQSAYELADAMIKEREK